MHTDPELLALLALGEQVGTEDERRHVQTCPVCAAELAELQQVAVLVREAAGITIAEPSPRVWAAIRDELDARSKELADAQPELTAHARLSAVGAWPGASGDARLATDGSGRRLLQVTLRADLPADGVRQAWLVHRDDPGRRQTLGILDGRHGLWTVEHAIDLTEFPILDITQQSLGSTEHSGQTIVRGQLVPAS
jgi:hypothetical protein